MPLVTLALCLAVGSNGLIKAPSAFVRKLPIVILSVTEKGKTESRRFLVDSGCDQSTLFSDSASMDNKPRPLELSIEGKKRRSLGMSDFVDRPDSVLGADLAKLLREAKIDGLLGVSFLQQHDVLIDYKKSEVSMTPVLPAKLEKDEDAPPSTLPSKSFKYAPLIPSRSGFGITGVIDTKPMTIAVMLVDTGCEATVLPLSTVPKEKPSNALPATMTTATGVHKGWMNTGQMGLMGIEKPFKVTIWYLDDVDPVLAPSDLAPQVFFSLRRSEMWVNR